MRNSLIAIACIGSCLVTYRKWLAYRALLASLPLTGMDMTAPRLLISQFL